MLLYGGLSGNLGPKPTTTTSPVLWPFISDYLDEPVLKR